MDRVNAPEEVRRLRKLSPRLDELILIDMRRDYNVFRKAFFGNSVPPVEAIMFGRTTCPIMKKATDRNCYGFYIRSPFDDLAMAAIVVAEDSDFVTRGMTMLHEMAHLKVDFKMGREMGHGKYWQAEMTRLARLGAFRRMW